MEEAFYENNRVDALAMERLTASKYIINIYGFCAMTVVQEFASQELSRVAHFMPPIDRLELAVKAARGVADIHSIPSDQGGTGSTLVHNDLNLANLVVTPDNRPVWNDFNVAILLMRNTTSNSTCPFIQHFPNPQWRAPEEQVVPGADVEPIVTSKTDVYALGNVLYRLAVGHSPWKDATSKKHLSREEKDEIAVLKKFNGTVAPIPSNITHSPDAAVHVMLKAMHMCYQWDPEQRPGAMQVWEFLDENYRRLMEPENPISPRRSRPTVRTTYTRTRNEER